MGKALFTIASVLLFILPAQAMDVVDGHLEVIESFGHSGKIIEGSDGRTIDIVGDVSYSANNTGVAKGNSYRIDIDVVLNEAEFWLDFSDSQILTYYVFDCPTEFGTYSEVYRDSEEVTGSGAGWYSSGALSIDMYTGTHYIIIVSWDGNMTYFFGVGESQDTSFGAHTHGYASGSDPLPSSFESTSNDQAIYHQRLTTVEIGALEMSTWGAIKACLTE